MAEKKGKIGVVGIGNVLMGDDAAGPYLIKLLKAGWDWPEGAELADAGTAGLALPELLEGYTAVILVDTVEDEGGAGSVCRYDREALLSSPGTRARTPHDAGLRDALILSELAGNGPREVVLIGVVPECTGRGVGLSRPVRRAMALLEAAVTDELARLEVRVTRKANPLPPDLWWERPAGPAAGASQECAT